MTERKHDSHHNDDEENRKNLTLSLAQAITIGIVIVGIVGGLWVGRIEHISSEQDKTHATVIVHEKDIAALKEQFCALQSAIGEVKNGIDDIRRAQNEFYKRFSDSDSPRRR